MNKIILAVDSSSKAAKPSKWPRYPNLAKSGRDNMLSCVNLDYFEHRWKTYSCISFTQCIIPPTIV